MEKFSNFVDVFEQSLLLDGVDDGNGDRARERTTAEGRAMHAGSEGEGGLVGAEHRAHGNAVCNGLRQCRDIGQDAVVLVGEPFSGAAYTALNFVGEEEGAGGVAELASGGEELLCDRVNAAFALNSLDADGTDFVGEFCAQIVYVVEADELYVGHDGGEGLAIFFLVRGCDRTHGASVEAVFEGEKLCADVSAFGAETPGVSASELKRRLPCFRAAVGEEDSVEAADFG